MFANHIRKDEDKKNTKIKRRIKLEKIGIDLFIVTKAILSYDLRDVQYRFVLFVRHTLELTALGFIRPRDT